MKKCNQMKMKTLAVFALVVSVTLAQGQEKEHIKENASNSVVQDVLAQPDGVSLVRSESDGSLQVFSRGTASYDFGDARDIRDTTKIAELKAKAALSKYLKEVVQVSELAEEGSGSLSRTLLTETHDGVVSKKNVSRDVTRKVTETIVVHSASILTGVVVLKTIKAPKEGSKTSGEIQVTLGISTKTLAAATEAHGMLVDSLNARQKVGENRSRTSGANDKVLEGDGTNKLDVRTNDTLF